MTCLRIPVCDMDITFASLFVINLALYEACGTQDVCEIHYERKEESDERGSRYISIKLVSLIPKY